MQMPEMDGLQFLKLLRASELAQARAIPVVVVTARSDADRLLSEGFSSILHKPFSLAQLTDCLSAVWQEAPRPVVGESVQRGADHSTGGYDFSSLTAFAGDDEAARRKILQTFLQELTAQIDEVEAARQRRDGLVVTRVAHKWQPIFAMLKATTVLPLLSRLEEEGTGTWTDELSAHLTRVLDCAGQVRDELQSILKKEEQA